MIHTTIWDGFVVAKNGGSGLQKCLQGVTLTLHVDRVLKHLVKF